MVEFILHSSLEGVNATSYIPYGAPTAKRDPNFAVENPLASGVILKLAHVYAYIRQTRH